MQRRAAGRESDPSDALAPESRQGNSLHDRAPEADGTMTDSSSTKGSERPRLFHWAYLRHIPSTLNDLAELALPERWEFKDPAVQQNRPKPILYSYLVHTFDRLEFEGKVQVSENGNFAAFNTGLVDRRYEPIYALFRRQDDPRAPWQLVEFCTAGERASGQNLV